MWFNFWSEKSCAVKGRQEYIKGYLREAQSEYNSILIFVITQLYLYIPTIFMIPTKERHLNICVLVIWFAFEPQSYSCYSKFKFRQYLMSCAKFMWDILYFCKNKKSSFAVLIACQNLYFEDKFCTKYVQWIVVQCVHFLNPLPFAFLPWCTH